MLSRHKDKSFSSFAVWIKSVLRSGRKDELAELNDRMDCLQRAIANLTRLVAENSRGRY